VKFTFRAMVAGMSMVASVSRKMRSAVCFTA
jgi:hypothetical protein